MQNPYEKEGVAHSEVSIGNRACCAIIGVFILILLLPPLYRNVYQATVGGDGAWVPVTEIFKKPEGQKITTHLKVFEKDLEDKARFTGPPRQFVQGVLSGTFREGNRKTYIGRDGWLYLKPALDAMTGYGPISPEPDSVAKDPNRAPWGAPLGAIGNFAGQLEELGVDLLLVPIPVKPMIYPEHISGQGAGQPLQHRDAAEFYRRIGALANVRVLDLSQEFWTAKGGTQIFLKQDTHWTPDGMQVTASKIADSLPPEWKGEQRRVAGPPVEVASVGDLVEKLELPRGGLEWFLRESVTVQPVADFTPDPTADITLLGDSFTNIYSMESLGWGEGAGLAEHLSHLLGKPIDVIAKNGQASTGVREELAKRGKEHLRKKKVIIWAIAARDLFLSETTARENDVSWGDVTIPDIPDTAKKPASAPAPTEALQITGTLIMKSAIKDPNSVTYKNAIFLCEYQVDEVVDGDYDGQTILVKDWAFRDKELTRASLRKLGDKVPLKLVPFDTKTKLQSEQEFNDIDTEDIDKLTMLNYWSEPVDPSGDQAALQPGGSGATANKTRANTIAVIACAMATMLVVALARRLARG